MSDRPNSLIPLAPLPSADSTVLFRQEPTTITGTLGLTTFSDLRIDVQVVKSATTATAPGLPLRPAVTWAVASGTATGTGSTEKPTPSALKAAAPICLAPSSAEGTSTTNAVTFLIPDLAAYWAMPPRSEGNPPVHMNEPGEVSS